MSKGIRGFINNAVHAISANAIRLVISVVLTLALPKVLGVESYSYWQLYLFYLMYLVYSSLGWCEGVYLNNGGKEYDEINKYDIAGQFWGLLSYQLIFSVFMAVIFILFVQDEQKRFILPLVMVSAFLEIMRYYLQMVLQATNRIKSYARLAGSERLLFFLFVSICMIAGIKDFSFYIYSEISARILTLIVGVIIYRDIVFVKLPSFKKIKRDALQLINNGYKLLLGYLASTLVIGVVRFAIEQKWGTIIFGKVSLTLSMSNMIITSIGAVGIALFPILKKLSHEKLPQLYRTIRTVIGYPVLLLHIFYLPIYIALCAWLPDYADSLKYLAILLPVCVFEVRSFLLTDTYFKAYNRPDLMLLGGMSTVALSIGVSAVSVFVLNSLDLAVISIVFLVAVKSILAEILLKKFVGKVDWKSIIGEWMLVIIFILSNWLISGWFATLIYVVSFGIYSFIYRKKLKMDFKSIKDQMTLGDSHERKSEKSKFN